MKKFRLRVIPTAGKWRAEGGSVLAEDGTKIAQVWGVYPRRIADEVIANMNLLAAAPELLDALEECLPQVTDESALRKAKEIIAKARSL